MYNPVVVMPMAAPNTSIESRSAFLVTYLFLGLGFGFGLELGLVVFFVSLSLLGWWCVYDFEQIFCVTITHSLKGYN